MPRSHDAAASITLINTQIHAAMTESANSAPPAVARIGDLLAARRALTDAQVAQVLQQQRSSGRRFGETAVALGLVDADIVREALAEQFRYPATPQPEQRLHADLDTLNEPQGAQAEHYRTLRSQLGLLLGGRSRRTESGERTPESRPAAGRSLAVVSHDSGDGRTRCAANLAISLAQLGERVVLVDADLRRPRVHHLFKLRARTGLTSVLAGRADERLIQSVPQVAGLFVLPAGAPAPNPLELVERVDFARLVQALQRRFDHVVIDTPAAHHGADALVIASRCQAALLVARRHASRMDAVGALHRALAGAGVKVAGAVLHEH